MIPALSFTANGIEVRLFGTDTDLPRVEIGTVVNGIFTADTYLSDTYGTVEFARQVARHAAQLIAAGTTLAELRDLKRANLAAAAIDQAIAEQLGGGHAQPRDAARLATLTAARDQLTPAFERARLDALAADIIRTLETVDVNASYEAACLAALVDDPRPATGPDGQLALNLAA